MFGYIYVNEQELKVRELVTYRGFYCGLCRTLHQRYGRTAQLLLNYDLTFLAILHTGLYETPTRNEHHRCLIHPAVSHLTMQSEAVEYAADMCVLLSWYKLVDDWKDEKKVSRLTMANILYPDVKKLKQKYPRQSAAIEKNIRLLARAEQENSTDVDKVSGYTGRFLAEIFVWKDDVWQEDLRTMGFFLGKFIYLMDALDDVEKDRKKGNYNLFLSYGDVWSEENREKIRGLLTEMMIVSSAAFERLPVLEHAEIIRNILYSGVWCRYQLLEPGTKKKIRARGI